MMDSQPPAEIGTRIRLIHMPGDPDPIPPGSTGTVTKVDHIFEDHWSIEVDWDPEVGRSLGLVYPEDEFEVSLL